VEARAQLWRRQAIDVGSEVRNVGGNARDTEGATGEGHDRAEEQRTANHVYFYHNVSPNGPSRPSRPSFERATCADLTPRRRCGCSTTPLLITDDNGRDRSPPPARSDEALRWHVG